MRVSMKNCEIVDAIKFCGDITRNHPHSNSIRFLIKLNFLLLFFFVLSHIHLATASLVRLQTTFYGGSNRIGSCVTSDWIPSKLFGTFSQNSNVHYARRWTIAIRLSSLFSNYGKFNRLGLYRIRIPKSMCSMTSIHRYRTFIRYFNRLRLVISAHIWWICTKKNF